MRRLKSWLLTEIAKPRDVDAFAALPFDANEIARVFLSSGVPGDMKRLANELLRPGTGFVLEMLEVQRVRFWCFPDLCSCACRVGIGMAVD